MASGRFSSAYLVDFDDSSQAFVPAGSLKPPADAKQARCILQFKRIDSQPTAHDREGGGSLVRDVKSLTTSGQAADTCLVVVLAMLAYVGNRKEPFPAPLQSLRFVSPTKLEVTLVCGDDQRYDEVEAQFQGVFKSLTLLRGPQHRLPVKNNSLPTAQPAVNASQRVVSPVNGGAFHSGASHNKDGLTELLITQVRDQVPVDAGEADAPSASATAIKAAADEGGEPEHSESSSQSSSRSSDAGSDLGDWGADSAARQPLDGSGSFVVLVSQGDVIKELAPRVAAAASHRHAVGAVVAALVKAGKYDARARATLKSAVRHIGRAGAWGSRELEGGAVITWAHVVAMERELADAWSEPPASAAAVRDVLRAMASLLQKHASPPAAHYHVELTPHRTRAAAARPPRPPQASSAKPAPNRGWKIGAAAAGGGALLFYSGGLAAPAIAAAGISALGSALGYMAPSLATWLSSGAVAAAAAAAESSASCTAISSIFGATGASWEDLPHQGWWREHAHGGEEHVLVWETTALSAFVEAVREHYPPSYELPPLPISLAVHCSSSHELLPSIPPHSAWRARVQLVWQSATRKILAECLRHTQLGPVVSAASLPLALLDAAAGLDSPWTIALQRSKECGQLLADVLLARPAGARPVTLVGYSMGARVIFACLEALAAAGERGHGIVEAAVLMGAPIGKRLKRWRRARSVVAGRLVNCYSTKDFVLALVYRSKSWKVGVAGVSPVEAPGLSVENLDLSHLLAWHLNYPKLLPHVMAVLKLEE
ncbi:hypothetical protein JKP88DRAFT_260842 [Tribonema minus]|uniref:Transmembrane and coiled-coil domain-containing protein 4 n=1 Tax=Tribonema minus TaxID=303371 RepID=A0A835ZL14_9STRA|nr:hypothetical protein JKP88DRAFT_260842 [Tribonema minus]